MIRVKKGGDAFSPTTDLGHLGDLMTFKLPSNAKSAWVEYQDPQDGQTKQVPVETFRRWVGDGEPTVTLASPADGLGSATPAHFIAGPSSAENKGALISLDGRLADAFAKTGVWH